MIAIPLGVLAAYLWSLYALFLGDAGMTGMTMTFSWLPEEAGAMDEIYLVGGPMNVWRATTSRDWKACGARSRATSTASRRWV